MKTKPSQNWMRVCLLLLAAGGLCHETRANLVAPSQTFAAPQSNPASSPPPLTWRRPAAWKEVPPGEIRVASFRANGAGQQADISVIPLGGMAGGDGANVNRWRGQVGLPVLPPAALEKLTELISIDRQPAALFDFAGTNLGSGEVTRVIAAIQHRDDTTWFFKMSGDGDLVEQQKPAFREFLKSVVFSGVPAAMADLSPNLPPGHPALGANPPGGEPDHGGAGGVAAGGFDPNAPLPAGHPAFGSNPQAVVAAAAPVSHEGQPQWQVPAAWQEISGGQFLVAKFVVPGAAINVSRSAGDGGGTAANVNRWRGQLGLPPVEAVAGLALPVDAGKALLVDLTGTSVQSGQPARVVGVQVTLPGQTWFYKIMGSPEVVAAQKDNFIGFVRHVQY